MVSLLIHEQYIEFNPKRIIFLLKVFNVMKQLNV